MQTARINVLDWNPDASFFTGLSKRKVGLSPAQYRRRFGSLKRRLSGAGEGRPQHAETAPLV